jgi:hypothetical protein
MSMAALPLRRSLHGSGNLFFFTVTARRGSGNLFFCRRGSDNLFFFAVTARRGSG